MLFPRRVDARFWLVDQRLPCMRRQSSQPWSEIKVIWNGFVVSFRRTEIGNYCDLKSNSNFFRNKDLINIISLKYSIKRGIEVIQQSHNLQVKKKDNRKMKSGKWKLTSYLVLEKNKRTQKLLVIIIGQTVHGLAHCRIWLGTALAVAKQFNMYKPEICFVFFSR